MKIHDYVREGNIEGVKAELANGVSINAIEEETGMTPYECVFENMDVDMMMFMVEQGALPTYTAPVEEEKSELVLAVQAGDIEKTRQLLDDGADINEVSSSGYDILTRAIFGPAPLELFMLLIERGAKVDGESEYGESALSVASRLGRFDIVRKVLNAGGPPEYVQLTELMLAILYGDVAMVRQHLEAGADLTARDRWERTPLLLAIHAGEIEKVELLLQHEANRNDKGRGGHLPLAYPIEVANPAMLRWLIDKGFDIEAQSDYQETALMVAAENGSAECVKILLDAGARLDPTNHVDNRAIDEATTLEVVRLLIQAGDDLNDINDEMRAALLGFEYEGQVDTTSEAYQQGKTPRYGLTNPEKMELPFWDAMVRSGAIAHNPRVLFDDVDYAVEAGPVWCFKRFGKSITELPDGRFIEIAGEHEDSYDPDFCIYNDVFVHHGGGRFDIYGYPGDVFPPTDFHSATLVGKYIYIIGSLGYPEDRRVGETPVYRLDTESFAIEAVKTSGKNPGWISRHRAVYREGEGITISGGQVLKRSKMSDNKDQFTLDLTTLKWRKLVG